MDNAELIGDRATAAQWIVNDDKAPPIGQKNTKCSGKILCIVIIVIIIIIIVLRMCQTAHKAKAVIVCL